MDLCWQFLLSLTFLCSYCWQGGLGTGNTQITDIRFLGQEWEWELNGNCIDRGLEIRSKFEVSFFSNRVLFLVFVKCHEKFPESFYFLLEQRSGNMTRAFVSLAYVSSFLPFLSRSAATADFHVRIGSYARIARRV